ncbi:hypothetical protein NJB14197_11420 [Mycobacterium montefiorense]|uniref:Uncharacterized protein n=1 Tax=Mycobacterium montefiorense TaxID=154654 RepID=A0AA37PQS0_9MYCO|nr:hypothetical protein MmonteBS_09490 [Mycobacterium montefiorense]GKU36926.1 hypothetical protein NJB14191_42720 [Mycobacterium montefiorense]GKU43168.1 hypothetical protein NJB14192_51510 [Mycobacterium montefiorense]GKU48521.1 hypothetical protein NJB14194_51360 [Mycobacterium montefiorense]GKU50551.1 hypothetical protein NJB14195_17970 [Mycobacterium montefiorense]
MRLHYVTSGNNFNANDAVVLYLRRYPGKNEEEFNLHYGSAREYAHEQVQLLLKEAMRIEPDWNRLTLNEAGDYIESVMQERHPDLTSEALEAIGNYYTFLMR